MTATMKKGVATIALAAVLLASMASMAGLSLHMNAVTPQHQSSISTGKLADGGPGFVCPPPPFVCD